jgi:hypothetical protein
MPAELSEQVLQEDDEDFKDGAAECQQLAAILLGHDGDLDDEEMQAEGSEDILLHQRKTLR